jgi:hypothetical protein
VWRTNSGGLHVERGGRRRFYKFNSQPGLSDCVGVCPGGRALAIEFKREGNKATAQQSAFLDDVRKQGGLALVVDSLDSLRRQLREAGYTVP